LVYFYVYFVSLNRDTGNTVANISHKKKISQTAI